MLVFVLTPLFRKHFFGVTVLDDVRGVVFAVYLPHAEASWATPSS